MQEKEQITVEDIRIKICNLYAKIKRSDLREKEQIYILIEHLKQKYIETLNN